MNHILLDPSGEILDVNNYILDKLINGRWKFVLLWDDEYDMYKLHSAYRKTLMVDIFYYNKKLKILRSKWLFD